MADVLLVLLFGIAGGICRVLLGYKKSFDSGLSVSFESKRAAVTLLSSALCGALAAAILADITNTPISISMSIIAGLAGPDLLEGLWRGLVKKVSGGAYSPPATVPSGGAGFADRKMSAVEFAKKNGRITNDDYQRLTGVSHRTAVRDLDALVLSGQLKRYGRKKSVYYKIR